MQYTWEKWNIINALQRLEAFYLCHLGRTNVDSQRHEQILLWSFNASQARCDDICPVSYSFAQWGCSGTVVLPSEAEAFPLCSVWPEASLDRLQPTAGQSWPHVSSADCIKKRKGLSRTKQTNRRMRGQISTVEHLRSEVPWQMVTGWQRKQIMGLRINIS